MLRKNLSQQSLTKQPARISMSKKLPSDFFLQIDSPKSLPFRRHRKLAPINDENRQALITKSTDVPSFGERKMSFQFTFYRSPSHEENRVPFEVKKEKSSKKEILQKFNIKLPYIVKSAQSGQQRRKKLIKVRRTTNFSRQIVLDQVPSPLR